MKVLVTGVAGFIGYHVARRLVDQGHAVLGIDNLNRYYDVRLKLDRLRDLGLEFAGDVGPAAGPAGDAGPAGGDAGDGQGEPEAGRAPSGLRFRRLDLTDSGRTAALFAEERFDAVCHLAAQAGVRYSLSDPFAYTANNVHGFLSVLEAARHHPVRHLVYASSSSVYGLDRHVPFGETGAADHPVSLYAATKRANELMAHSYSHLFGIPTTGLRFFTVYGPWGRPRHGAVPVHARAPARRADRALQPRGDAARLHLRGRRGGRRGAGVGASGAGGGRMGRAPVLAVAGAGAGVQRRQRRARLRVRPGAGAGTGTGDEGTGAESADAAGGRGADLGRLHRAAHRAGLDGARHDPGGSAAFRRVVPAV